MKEIKAYIRQSKAHDVISAIEEAGVPGFTLIEVKGMGAAAEPESAKYSVEYAEKISPIIKIEIVCNDEDVKRLVDVIRKNAYTGHKGDGMIFVSDANYALKIRTGEEGEKALASAPNNQGHSSKNVLKKRE